MTSRAGMMQAIDLFPEPYGTVNSIQDLQMTIKNTLKIIQPRKPSRL
ncbi:hypothetical protein [Chryseobacterium carnipullorum]|nr:hypothetical protein [Chryseobacterium carnipullorum]